MNTRYFYGWNVVGATFVMALFSFGLGFYGVAVYVATLQQLHGWSASTVSAPVTVYYVAGALLTVAIAGVYERFGAPMVVAGGAVAMAAGVAMLGLVAQPWELYPVFLVMSIGWGAMSGAAINIVLAPWFQRRRGLAVSLAFNGATLGGVIVAPALIQLVGRVGFARALSLAALAELVVLLALAAAVMRRGPETLGLGPDGDAPGACRSTRTSCGTSWARSSRARAWPHARSGKRETARGGAGCPGPSRINRALIAWSTAHAPSAAPYAPVQSRTMPTSVGPKANVS